MEIDRRNTQSPDASRHEETNMDMDIARMESEGGHDPVLHQAKTIEGFETARDFSDWLRIVEQGARSD